MAQQDNENWPLGLEVVQVRPITPEESEAEGWFHRGDCSVIELSDGSRIYPSQDPEGNGPGALFGALADGSGVDL